MVVGVIPARLRSQRFPQKILTPIDGKPMVVQVYNRALKATSLDEVIIAIDSDETKTALKSYKVNMIMTDPDHVSGSDRVGEVIKGMDVDVVVNIQGDEPALDPTVIDGLVSLFDDPTIEMATAASTRIHPADMGNANAVKVLLDESGFAVTFLRTVNKWEMGGAYFHIGIYAYRKETLLRFMQLPPSENEKTFRLEQLRALDNGIRIKTLLTDYIAWSVDTPEDLDNLPWSPEG